MNGTTRLGQPEGRDTAADILKCLCCVSVVIIHTGSLGFTTYIVRSFNWAGSFFWTSLFRFCVPVFLMCSGALLLNPAKELSIRRILTHYFLRILAVLLVWSLLYDLYFVAAKFLLYGQYEPGSLWQAFFNTVTFRHYFHLYYLQILLIFYLFLPALRLFVQHADRRLYRYVLLIWFILGIILPCLWQLEPMASNDGVPAQYPMSTTYAAMGYTLLGWYLRSAGIRRADAKRYIGLFFAGYAVICLATVGISLYIDTPYGGMMEAMTPGVALMALGLYGTVSALVDGRGEMPRVARMAKATFCIYLVHHMFVAALRATDLFHLYNVNELLGKIHPALGYCLFSIPLLSAAALGMSILAYLILSRIPFVRKYLI